MNDNLMPFEKVLSLGTKASKKVKYQFQVPFETCEEQITEIWQENTDKIQEIREHYISSDSETKNEKEKKLYLFFFGQLKKKNHVEKVTVKDKTMWRYRLKFSVKDVNNSLEKLDMLKTFEQFFRKVIEFKTYKDKDSVYFNIYGQFNYEYLQESTDDIENIVYDMLSEYVRVTDIELKINKRIYFSKYVDFDLNKVDYSDDLDTQPEKLRGLFSEHRKDFNLDNTENLVIDMTFGGYNLNSSPDDNTILEAIKDLGERPINSVNYLKGKYFNNLLNKLHKNSPFID